MRESGDTVHMNVLSVNSDQIREVVAPRRVNINKEKGTFGFYIFQDDKGQSSLILFFNIFYIVILSGVGMIQDSGGYRLQLVTRMLISGRLPVPTGNQNFVLRMVTGYQWLPEFWSQGGYRSPLSRLLVTSGYQKIKKFKLR